MNWQRGYYNLYKSVSELTIQSRKGKKREKHQEIEVDDGVCFEERVASLNVRFILK